MLHRELREDRDPGGASGRLKRARRDESGGSLADRAGDDHTAKLAERYDREALAYRDLWAPVLRPAGLGLVRALAQARPRTILDLGTGVGSLLSDLRTTFPGAVVVGVDRSRGMLALAPAGTLRSAMDATRLAIRAASVDLVFAVFMLFHLERPEDGLQEARRVLRPGGRIGTLTWRGEFESRAMRVWSDCLDEHGATAPDPATTTRHEPVDSREKMEALLSAAGFRPGRSWEDQLIDTIDLDHLIRLRTSMGAFKPRYDSLDAEARSACVATARRRMQALQPEDFVARGTIVHAVAEV